VQLVGLHHALLRRHLFELLALLQGVSLLTHAGPQTTLHRRPLRTPSWLLLLLLGDSADVGLLGRLATAFLLALAVLLLVVVLLRTARGVVEAITMLLAKVSSTPNNKLYIIFVTGEDDIARFDSRRYT
jgi:hypothetical protein